MSSDHHRHRDPCLAEDGEVDGVSRRGRHATASWTSRLLCRTPAHDRLQRNLFRRRLQEPGGGQPARRAQRRRPDRRRQALGTKAFDRHGHRQRGHRNALDQHHRRHAPAPDGHFLALDGDAGPADTLQLTWSSSE